MLARFATLISWFAGTVLGFVGTVLGFVGTVFCPVRILSGIDFIQLGFVATTSGFVRSRFRFAATTVDNVRILIQPDFIQVRYAATRIGDANEAGLALPLWQCKAGFAAWFMWADDASRADGPESHQPAKHQ